VEAAAQVHTRHSRSSEVGQAAKHNPLVSYLPFLVRKGNAKGKGLAGLDGDVAVPWVSSATEKLVRNRHKLVRKRRVTSWSRKAWNWEEKPVTFPSSIVVKT